MKQKTLREDRTAAAGKYVACTTRRRRRILRAGFFFTHPSSTRIDAGVEEALRWMIEAVITE